MATQQDREAACTQEKSKLGQQRCSACHVQGHAHINHSLSSIWILALHCMCQPINICCAFLTS